MSTTWVCGLVCLCLAAVAAPPEAGAVTKEEQAFLGLYFSPEELEILSATRSLKSVASIAESVAVVTAEDIELANAHTVAEALYNVTGIEITDFRGPGSSANASIHGSGRDRVTTLLDGVLVDTANNGFQLATMPVQMIRRIEIVKGPASSAWGSSFGGVVNVITKSVEVGDRFDGTASISLGERGTSDARAELQARKGPVGFYLFGGGMDSDGLPRAGAFEHDNVYAKLSVDAGRASRVDLSFFSHRSDSESADLRQLGWDAHTAFGMETLHGKADVRTSFKGGLDLTLSAWWLRQDDNFYEFQPSTGERTRDGPTLCERNGVSGSLAWRRGRHALVAGADFADWDFEHRFEPYDSIGQRKRALYVNDTITAGDLSVTPGVRYDHSSLAGDVLSPSLGVTWLASSDLLLKAAVSRGFHDPAIVKYFDAPRFGYYASEGIGPETIWSYQAGVEANLADLLRAGLTLFYHDIDDILVEKSLDLGVYTAANAGSARTVGGEIVVATNRYGGFVLEGGVHHEQLSLFDYSDPRFPDVRHVTGVNATLSYRGEAGLRGVVKAHWSRRDMADLWAAESGGVVVDASVTEELLRAGATRWDVFAGAHNIFDADSYDDVTQRNPGRWVEAGVRCSF